ncbi:MarR family transcriptional regulator [Microtetraspora sp. NBRC 13810]|uniref:GbsR/MarR family transcriptional regulator n=1 Tax=Microtetraspora sp. NBRC 13810 TaxID=3030990 RepID=UPI0024A3CEA3|nr:MarR family transcriptional regulator [Microtetraspora sp. NBRC 13810]GLW09507.1 MarR family transcriptional regulator [Microtetraspora sp. NBRC 13810]
MAETIGGTTGTGDDREIEALRFVERFALIMSESGYPRMAARVFVALMASPEGALTAARLAEMLQVGPSAISGAVKYLIRVGMVTRERDPGHRRDRYRVDQASWYAAAASSDAVYRRFEEGARDGVEVLGADTPAGARLDETRRFFAFLRREVPDLLRRWREYNDATRQDA